MIGAAHLRAGIGSNRYERKFVGRPSLNDTLFNFVLAFGRNDANPVDGITN